MFTKSYLDTRLSQLNQSLQRVVTKENPGINYLKTHYKYYTNSLFGGKFLRGLLVCMGYELSGNELDKSIVEVASAFEMMHTSLLIHDDIMDQSDLRRNKPSLHLALGGERKGESLALCFGDLGLIWAVQLINNSKFSTEYKNKAVNYLCQSIKDTIYGQLLDITLSNSLIKDPKDIIKIHKLKTSTYSFVSPLGTGLLLGGSDNSKLKIVKHFGTNLGIAFQIHDDILGVFGDEKKMGKSVMSDIKEGKNTLLISHAMANASQDQKKFLLKYYGNSNVTPEHCETIKDIFTKTKALSHSKSAANRYLKLGQDLIPSISKDKKDEALLYEFSNTVVNRNK